ncbi:Uncharacterised protein [Vibrio cholerae]|uniref:Uncharacterized protein n=1 Tax=Vibrio cholerae TaxID=666 RepID=A0A655Y6Q0_VIBCL|nr:Uncharacterised protein [Vibrio cholerae]
MISKRVERTPRDASYRLTRQCYWHGYDLMQSLSSRHPIDPSRYLALKQEYRIGTPFLPGYQSLYCW